MSNKKTPVWVHATQCKQHDVNAFVVKEKVLEITDTGERIWTDNLKIYNDPKRPFWITKPSFRNHTYKKEFEDIASLDKFTVRDSELEAKIKQNLKVFTRSDMRTLCNSPFIYGADIPTGVLIRHHYKVNSGGIAPRITVGALDIESEVRNQKRIIILSFVVDNKVYTAYLDEYLMKTDSEGKRIRATEAELIEVINRELENEIRDYKLDITLFNAKSELDLIVWVFQQIHRHKTDFVGIWNMNFDIPKILERLKELGADIPEVMCSPDLPKKYKYVKYYTDKRQCEHFTDKWHWMNVTGYTQFVDSMCLYARLRKAKGRESAYTLEAISNKIIGMGKMKLGKITNHWYEQNYHFMRYVAYNIKDTILIPLMELQTKDCTSLLALTDVSQLSDFNKQTVMGKNSTFFYAKEKGKIIASAGSEMKTPFDELIPKLGGTVLPTNKAVGIGINALEENNQETQVNMMVNDLDVASEYPSVTEAFNISKETKLFTVVAIDGFHQLQTEDYFSNVTSPMENSVYLGHKFYGLPDYQQMQAIVAQKITEVLLS